MDCSLPGSSVHGIFQARVPEWGATAFSEDRVYLPLKNSPLHPDVCVLLTSLVQPASSLAWTPVIASSSAFLQPLLLIFNLFCI